MGSNLKAISIRGVAFIAGFALASYGCSASRVVRTEIVRGNLEKTELGKQPAYTKKELYIQENDPLQVKIIEISELKKSNINIGI